MFSPTTEIGRFVMFLVLRVCLLARGKDIVVFDTPSFGPLLDYSEQSLRSLDGICAGSPLGVAREGSRGRSSSDLIGTERRGRERGCQDRDLLFTKEE